MKVMLGERGRGKDRKVLSMMEEEELSVKERMGMGMGKGIARPLYTVLGDGLCYPRIITLTRR